MESDCFDEKTATSKQTRLVEMYSICILLTSDEPELELKKYCNGFIQTKYLHNFKPLFRYVIQRNSEKKKNENFMLSLFKFQNLNRKEK